MNDQKIKELAEQCWETRQYGPPWFDYRKFTKLLEKELRKKIVKDVCGLLEQTEDDCYHCFEPGERSTEYIDWLNQWRTMLEKHFEVE